MPNISALYFYLSSLSLQLFSSLFARPFSHLTQVSDVRDLLSVQFAALSKSQRGCDGLHASVPSVPQFIVAHTEAI